MFLSCPCNNFRMHFYSFSTRSLPYFWRSTQRCWHCTTGTWVMSKLYVRFHWARTNQHKTGEPHLPQVPRRPLQKAFGDFPDIWQTATRQREVWRYIPKELFHCQVWPVTTLVIMTKINPGTSLAEQHTLPTQQSAECLTGVWCQTQHKHHCGFIMSSVGITWVWGWDPNLESVPDLTLTPP